jgi:hypothetical protein
MHEKSVKRTGYHTYLPYKIKYSNIRIYPDTRSFIYPLNAFCKTRANMFNVFLCLKYVSVSNTYKNVSAYPDNKKHYFISVIHDLCYLVRLFYFKINVIFSV